MSESGTADRCASAADNVAAESSVPGVLDFVRGDCLVKSLFYVHALDTKLINIAQ